MAAAGRLDGAGVVSTSRRSGRGRAAARHRRGVPDQYQSELIWERKSDGGFPDVKRLKQIVRDRLDPARDLGHLDRPGPAPDDAAD